MTDKEHFELTDNKTSIKIFKDGLYRIKCHIYQCRTRQNTVEIITNVDATAVHRTIMQCNGRNPVNCTLSSDVVCNVEANQEISFEIVNLEIRGGHLFDNTVHIEKL